MSIVHGPSLPTLYNGTIGDLIHERAQSHGDRTALVVPWQDVRLSYAALYRRSIAVASSLLERGIGHGSIVAIMAGNRYEYLEVFLGASCIGATVAVINNTYTPKELKEALTRISCRALFIAWKVSNRSLEGHIAAARGLLGPKVAHKSLKHVIVFDAPHSRGMESYAGFTDQQRHQGDEQMVAIRQIAKKVSQHDVVNIQFTSGTTGSPKAAMLTHRNIINNGAFVGVRMDYRTKDIVCCPPPLFHCFGLVMGFLASLFHSTTLVFPGDAFDAAATIDAVFRERCTVIMGVPTMFVSELEAFKKSTFRGATHNIRTGVISGSTVSPHLLERLESEIGFKGILTAYGMTEMSPVSFMMKHNDMSRRLSNGLGTVLPHTSAKIVDKDGSIVPRGARGELWTSGFGVMKGYFDNPEATDEAFVVDEVGDGRVWMRTGDECVLDEGGYAKITGRIKDIIIRGGENIFPAEIEETIQRHKSISEASIIGVADAKYGEVVGCFLKQVQEGAARPNDEEVRNWVRDSLGRHKAPQWIFWIGDAGVGDDFPKTGSGKHQKHVLKVIAARLLKLRTRSDAKL